MIDIDELEALAKKATSGPWKYDLRVGRNAVYTENNNPNCLSDVTDSDHTCDMHGIYFDGKWNMTEQQDNNCKYIAAVNPTTVLELIKEVRKVRQKTSPCENCETPCEYEGESDDRCLLEQVAYSDKW